VRKKVSKLYWTANEICQLFCYSLHINSSFRVNIKVRVWRRPAAERRVPELIPVLGSQPAGDVSHKPGGRLPLLFARPAVTFVAAAIRTQALLRLSSAR